MLFPKMCANANVVNSKRLLGKSKHFKYSLSFAALVLQNASIIQKSKSCKWVFKIYAI